MASSSLRENVACLRVSRNSCAHVDQLHRAAWAAPRCGRAVRAACTCRARRCSGFPGWAWPSPAPRTRRRPARARWPRRGRCSAASPPACSCRRAPRPPRSGPGCAPARRRRSACPPPPTPRPSGCAATGRSARTSVKALCRMATRSPKRAKNWPAMAGVSAISGTSSSALRPSRQRRVDGVQIDLGLARSGDAVQQERVELLRAGWPRGSARRPPAARDSARAARARARR